MVTVVVPRSGGSAYSTNNGTSWTAGGDIGSFSDKAVLAYGNGIWVRATGGAKSTSYSTSTNGINWTSRTFNNSLNLAFVSMVYGNGLFVASTNVDGGCLYTSPDGITWTQRQPANYDSTITLRGLAYNGSIFVCFTYNKNYMLTSTDGITWSASSLSAGQYSANLLYDNITWTGSKFVAVSRVASSQALYSTNGTTWSSSTMTSSLQYWGIASNPVTGAMVAVADGGSVAAYSTNGTSWSNYTVGSTGRRLTGVCWDGTKFITTVYGSSQANVSSDGISWSNTTLPSSANWIGQIASDYTPSVATYNATQMFMVF